MPEALPGRQLTFGWVSKASIFFFRSGALALARKYTGNGTMSLFSRQLRVVKACVSPSVLAKMHFATESPTTFETTALP